MSRNESMSLHPGLHYPGLHASWNSSVEKVGNWISSQTPKYYHSTNTSFVCTLTALNSNVVNGDEFLIGISNRCQNLFKKNL